MLPLVHLHSLAALFVVTAFCFVLRPAKWIDWLLFGLGVCVVAIPELLWSTAGTASETQNFIGAAWGWDKKPEDSYLWFWLKNTGITVPVIAAGLWLIWSRGRRDDASPTDGPDRDLLLFYLPFGFLFIICNMVRFAPWEWDNIKLLIYWLVGSLPIMAYVIAWFWSRNAALRIAAGACMLALCFAGALDVYRSASGQISTRVFDADGVKIGNLMKTATEPRAVIMNMPTYNSPVALSGRISLMRYPGHLSSHGIDYAPREDDVKKIYSGGGVAEILLRKYDVSYVLIGPDERREMQANETFFSKYPVAADAGQYKLYKVK
jgi:hypothetical protein